MKRRVFVLVIMAVLLCLYCTDVSYGKQFRTTQETRKYIVRKFSRYGKVKFVRFDKLTDKELCHRAGKKKIIVDITYGICLNKKGDGRVLNTQKGYGNYISYRGLKRCRKGSRVTTYCVYEPWNNYVDGIWYRYDVVTKY